MMKYLLIVFVVLNLYNFSYGQDTLNIYNEHNVDYFPKFKIGDKEFTFKEYVIKKIVWTPGMTEGESIVTSFVIDTSGNVKNIEIIRMPEFCKECTRQFIKMLTSIPSITPAKKGDKNVAIKMKVYFKFEIIRDSY